MDPNLQQRFEAIESEIAAIRAGMGDLTELSTQQDEVLRRLDVARQELNDDVQSALSTFDTLQDQVDRMTDRMHGAVGRKLDQERARFTAWASTVADTFTDAMRKSLSRTLPSSMSESSMGVGAAGQKLGGTIGMAAGRAIGFFFGGPVGQQVGAQLGGSIVSTVARELETIMAGPRVTGARLAPMLTGGGAMPGGNRQFEQMGLEFMTRVRRISQLLNVSTDDVLHYAEPLSRVGKGFLQGADAEAMFAIATERVLALQPGTILKVQTELVSRYGESLKGARDILNQVRAGQREFIALNLETGSSIQKSIAAGQTYIDMLTQISAGASTSGASMRGLTEMAGALVKTMSTMAGGRAGMRPGQMTDVARSTLSALLPQISPDWNQEAKRSGVGRMLVDATGYGKEYARRVYESAPESMRHDPKFTFQMAEREYVTRNKKAGMQSVLAKMAGIYAAYKPHGSLLEAGRLAEELGVTPTGTGVIVDLMKDFEKSQGFNMNRYAPNAEKMFGQFMREKQKDPQYHARLKELGQFKDSMAVALEQGQGAKTAMDRIADAFDSVRGELTNYWDQWKQATAEVFGIQAGTSGASLAATAYAGVSAVANPFAAAQASGKVLAGAFREQREFRREAAPTAPAVSQQTTVIGKEAAKAIDFEIGARDVNVRTR